MVKLPCDNSLICDIMLGAKHQANTADSTDEKSRGRRYCIAGAPNNQNCTNQYEKVVKMHWLPLILILLLGQNG